MFLFSSIDEVDYRIDLFKTNEEKALGNTQKHPDSETGE